MPLATRFVPQATRSRASGSPAPRAITAASLLIEAAQPWRTDWLRPASTDDGWTRPGETAMGARLRGRVRAARGHRSVALRFCAPDDVATRPVDVSSNLEHWADMRERRHPPRAVLVCVPPKGFAPVRLSRPRVV